MPILSAAENAESSLLAGVELGGTKCVCILGDRHGVICDRVVISTGEPTTTIAAIKAVLSRWNFTALGIASFGPLDLDRQSSTYGFLLDTPKPGWREFSLLALAEGLPIPVEINTDVNGAALAEGLWGAAQSLTSWVYITVGTGIGVGSIVEGKPLRGLGHSEAGHIRVPRNGDNWPGICRFHGDCVEGLASGPAIEARAGVAAALVQADHPAWNVAAHALAALCHALVLTVLPQRILIGGGVALGQPLLLPMIRERLAESLGGYSIAASLEKELDRYLIHPKLGVLAGPLGAIALARTAEFSA